MRRGSGGRSSGGVSDGRRPEMASGSHKTWGGWETRSCAVCGVRIVLSRGSAMHCENAGRPFSLCGRHLSSYGRMRAAVAA